jgi:hypothetical protein
VTIHASRSKDRVVRLEPFFADTPLVPHEPPGRLPRGVLSRGSGEAVRPAGPQAARLGVAVAVDSNRTDIRLETPDSSIVTP